MRTVLAGLTAILLVGPAFADGKHAGTPPPPPREKAPQAPPTVVHKEGEYGGVIPGQKPEPTKGHPKVATAKGTLSWIGFEAKDGGAEVFFQSLGAFDVSQSVMGSTLFIYLTLPRLGHNTWRQIDTRYFDNPIAGMVARQVAAAKAGKDHPAHPLGIEVRVAFKNPKDAKEAAMKTATEPDGLYYAYLTFPEGTGEAKAAQPTMKDPEK